MFIYLDDKKIIFSSKLFKYKIINFELNISYIISKLITIYFVNYWFNTAIIAKALVNIIQNDVRSCVKNQSNE